MKGDTTIIRLNKLKRGTILKCLSEGPLENDIFIISYTDENAQSDYNDPVNISKGIIYSDGDDGKYPRRIILKVEILKESL